ncbi:hypothetical protein TVAG_186650 [Trichomonas vaginalis G3]|uniref:DUF3447 domain-containing protein n=1 Tax=Trichomonas vaginalis (strain ATCC PRA-98 / G3) TaxID=412133 RepID=A2FQA5_TRIV3|nr:spectrin binding [Trichomonas vaginalis G3]EAX92895.1 hypothetical protein TVAG_186650 [Trichomonas vaginalis G3]KAI5508316.1 spectrin binding [Trichomonas vaginalis G3]|eukprot:XP_001305825.1 hypothetical protein [Trichomonas vaginalis G3]
MTKINSLESLPADCQKLLWICESVWDINESNLFEIRQKIVYALENNILTERNVVKILNSVFSIRVRKMKLIADLLEQLLTQDKVLLKEKYFLYAKELKTILIRRKALEGDVPPEYEEKQEEDILQIYEKGTVEYCIVWDDYETLDKLYTAEGFMFDDKRHHKSILSCAALRGSVNCFKYLVLKGEKITQEDYEYAFAGNNKEILEMCEKDFQVTPQCIDNAVKWHHNKMVQEIMQNHELEYSWNTSLQNYNLPCYFTKLFKINYVNFKDIHQDNALIVAARFGLVPIVKLLLDEENAGIEEVNKYDQTALIAACENNFVGAMKVLIAHQANINVRDVFQRTPLISATNYNAVDAVRLLLANGAKVDDVDEQGNSALHITARENFVEILDILLEYKAKIDIKNNDGLTPLWLASSAGHPEIVKTLISHGADIEVKNQDGWTPLMIAAQFNRHEVAKCLMDAKADVNVKTADGLTAMDIAKNHGSRDAYRVLRGNA